METPNADANTTSNTDVSISSIDDGFRNIDPSVDNVPTVDVIPVKEEGTKPAGDAATKTVDDTAAADAAKDGEAGKAKPYHQDPDWQRMIKERDDARIEAAAAKAKLEVLAPAKPEGKKAEAAPDYIDITTKTKEELIEWQEDDPHGYAANLLAQVRAELKTEQAQELEIQGRAKQAETVKGTFEKYEKANPDFRTMWDSGELKKFMDENPGHNAISAHKELTDKSRMDAAIAKAVKDKEAEVIKNFQAKRNARVISDGGAPRDGGEPEELKNSQKYGGAVSVLASRLQRLRQAVGG